MSNAQKTLAFFAVTDAATKNDILRNIASHYGISSADALAEVTGSSAEHLLEYVTGPTRAAASLLMRRHGISA